MTAMPLPCFPVYLNVPMVLLMFLNIHSFYLANTFNDLFHHIYMSPDSHMKG